jgi:hypothetical protein
VNDPFLLFESLGGSGWYQKLNSRSARLLTGNNSATVAIRSSTLYSVVHNQAKASTGIKMRKLVVCCAAVLALQGCATYDLSLMPRGAGPMAHGTAKQIDKSVSVTLDGETSGRPLEAGRWRPVVPSA